MLAFAAASEFRRYRSQTAQQGGNTKPPGDSLIPKDSLPLSLNYMEQSLSAGLSEDT
jgi:hypothetical protein